MALFDTPVFATPNFIRAAANVPAPAQAIFYRFLGSAAVAAEKTNIETVYNGVGYNYEQEPNSSYKVTLIGPIDKFTAAMNFLFPNTLAGSFQVNPVTTAQGINLGDLTK